MHDFNKHFKDQRKSTRRDKLGNYLDVFMGFYLLEGMGGMKIERVLSTDFDKLQGELEDYVYDEVNSSQMPRYVHKDHPRLKVSK